MWQAIVRIAVEIVARAKAGDGLVGLELLVQSPTADRQRVVIGIVETNHVSGTAAVIARKPVYVNITLLTHLVDG